MSQPSVSQPCSPTHSPSGAVDLRSARRMPFAPSSPKVRQSIASTMTRIPSLEQPQHRQAAGDAGFPPSTLKDDGWSQQALDLRQASTEQQQRKFRSSPPPMTQLGSAPISNSLSTSAVSRQHVHTASVAGKRDSATLLASTSEAAAASRTLTVPSVSPLRRISRTPDVRYASEGAVDSHLARVASHGSNKSEASSAGSSIYDRRSRPGSADTVASSATSLASGMDGHVGAKQQQDIAPVDHQPPADPKMANKALKPADTAAVPPSPGVPRTDTSQALLAKPIAGTSTTVDETQHVAPPTIEQRDALAQRVYAACQAAGYEEWTQLLDMAPLASQHHLSGYNCIKFGQDGSPYAYLPFTLQQPMQANELMEKQKHSEANALTWLAQKRAKLQQRRGSVEAGEQRAKVPRLSSHGTRDGRDADSDVRMREASPHLLPTKTVKCRSCTGGSETTAGSESDNDNDVDIDGTGHAEGKSVCVCGPLKNDAALCAEWEAPIGESATAKEIVSSSANASGAGEGVLSLVAVKTSDTHPISISPIVPPELLADISRHVRQGILLSIGGNEQEGMLHHFDSQTSDEAHNALQVSGKRLIRCRTTKVDLSEVAARAERELIEASQQQRRPRTLILDPPSAPEPASQAMHDALCPSDDQAGSDGEEWTRQSWQLDRGLYCATKCCEDVMGWDEDCAQQQQSTTRDASLPNDIKAAAQDAVPTLDDEQHCSSPSSPSSFVMGNLLLSSCPGKKVRLTGPVRGRGAICRDLGLDLLRIRQLGVGAIVCCLDDEELRFLGSPWSEYEREADRLGIEVVRLPMAEGFCPTDVVATDKAIGCVVNDYTLRGVHVLVHCRGGVGRAGLIACMWMVKLGLVRSDRDELRFRHPLPALAHSEEEHGRGQGRGQRGGQTTTPGMLTASPPQPLSVQHPTGDVMQSVHRLIETIRRRRSPKAIETAEQVHFLVRYLSYLKDLERQRLRHVASTLASA